MEILNLIVLFSHPPTVQGKGRLDRIGSRCLLLDLLGLAEDHFKEEKKSVLPLPPWETCLRICLRASSARRR